MKDELKSESGSEENINDCLKVSFVLLRNGVILDNSSNVSENKRDFGASRNSVS